MSNSTVERDGFRTVSGEVIPATRYTNPDGTIGGIVPTRAQIDNSVIIDPDVVVFPGVVIAPGSHISGPRMLFPDTEA